MLESKLRVTRMLTDVHENRLWLRRGKVGQEQTEEQWVGIW